MANSNINNRSNDDKGRVRSNASSVSPDRSKAPAGPEMTKPSADPAPAKKTSLFGGKKDRLNPLMRKPSNKQSIDNNISNASGTGAFGGGAVGSTTGGGLGGPANKFEPLNFNNDSKDIGSGLGSGNGGFSGSKFAAKPADDELPKLGGGFKDPIRGNEPARVSAPKESSGSDYEGDDFELGESVANLAGKAGAKKDEQPEDQFAFDDFFAPGKANGKDGKPSDKSSEPPAFDDNYEDYTYDF